MNEEEVRKANEISQEELEKIELLKTVLEKAKALLSIDKLKGNIAEQLKKYYAQKMVYDFLQKIILKLHNDDVTKLSNSDIVNVLNTTTYTNQLREYLDLFATIADITTIDEGNGMISIHFYFDYDGYIHIARLNIFEDGSKENEILFGSIFDELQNILEIPKYQLQKDLVVFVNNLKKEIEESICDDDP